MPPDDSLSSQELTDVIAQDTGDEDASLSETIAAAIKASEEDEPSAEAPLEASDDEATDTSGESEEDDSKETPEGDDSEEEVAASDDDSEEKTDKPDDSEDEPDSEPAIEPPAQYSDADKELFRRQPREAQEFLLRRVQEMEADYTRKSMDVAEQRKATDAFNAVVEPYKPYLASLNVTPERAFQTLIAADYRLRNGTPEQKVQIAVQLARDYGIDLSELSEQSEDDAVSPEIAQVNQRLSGIERAFQAERSQAQTQLTQNAESQVTAFADEKDSAGNLLHPHFAEVRVVMGSLIAANPQLEVHTAYENAVWANPQLRDADLAKHRKEADEAAEQRQAEITKKAEQERVGRAKKARKAATSVKVGAETPGPSAETGEVSLRDEIKRSMAASSP